MLRKSFKEVTNAFRDPHILLDRKGDIVSANDAAQKRFLSHDHEEKPVNLSTVTTEKQERLDSLLEMWKRSKSPLPGSIKFNQNGAGEMLYVCKGSLVQPATQNQDALIMLQCTEKQKSTRAYVALNEKIEQLKREVFQRRCAEKEIRKLNQVLEQRVRERTADLEKANGELNASLAELQEAHAQLVHTERLASLGGMVAGVAHEINNPVGICVTAASYLDEQVQLYQQLYQADKLTRSDFEKLIELMAQSSKIILGNLGRASELVKSFKQLAVDQTSDEQREINLKNYIEELLISLHPYFRKQAYRYQVTCPQDVLVTTCPGAVSQIINNLIINSIRHGFENSETGKIQLDISAGEEHIDFDYRDNGAGMSADNLAQVFDPFFTTKRNQGGSGLGMTIVYNLVRDKLRGDISVDSKVGQGIHFHIRFPRNG